jgi:hypothetical protein
MDAPCLELDITKVHSNMGTMGGGIGYDHCLDIMLKCLTDG